MLSGREFARREGVPKSTLQDRAAAQRDDGLPEGWRGFFESEMGIAFTLRLILGVVLVFGVRGGCSAELAAEFFEVMHLRRYVATSPTSLRRLIAQIIPLINAWGAKQFGELAPGMPLRDIVLCLDENFHWDNALLGILDVASGFLFGENMSDRYDGETWEKAVRESLKGYNVCLRAVTRDGGSWLGVCAERMGVPAGSDIFHIQHAVCRATTGPLALRESKALAALNDRREELKELELARDRDAAAPRRPGRPTNWPAREAQAHAAIQQAQAHAAEMTREREEMRGSIRALGDAHHPVDLATGALVDAAEVRERLREEAEVMCQQAARCNLGARAIKALNGVFATIDDLAGIVAWWHREGELRVSTLSLSESERAWVTQKLTPALYIRHRIALARDEAQRRALGSLWASLRTGLLSADSPWHTWAEDRRRVVLGHTETWVRLFPRSTSGLEGYNGQDSLCRHQRHSLTEPFRCARRVIRNYVVRRDDGTTAAERLFGRKPGDLIEYLVGQVQLPGRGRLRSRAVHEPPLPLIA